jgi:carbon monoxide dehydrogenase subunit G
VKLEQSFEVQAPIDEVWRALIDVERVAPCLPGAGVAGRNEDGSYNGSFTVKIGPTTASYSGKLEMESIDEEAHTATMRAQGTDRRGQGGARATIVSTVSSAADGSTHVEVSTDYSITGRLARFGRGGMIEDISERLLREFAERLQASLSRGAGADQQESDTAEPAGDSSDDTPASASTVAAAEPPRTSEPASRTAEPPPPAEPLQAGSLIGSVVADRVKRNPTPLIAGMIFGFGLMFLLQRRRRQRRRKRRAREQSDQ